MVKLVDAPPTPTISLSPAQGTSPRRILIQQSSSLPAIADLAEPELRLAGLRFDYGGPAGFRMALTHPERVQALIVQMRSLTANWATRRAFWADRPAHEEALRKNLLSLSTTKTRHIGDDPKVELYDPDLWTDEYAFLNAPGRRRFKRSLL
jgi:hypothetical protein